ncbi:MAG: zinc ribbon domain-containing protein [Candidatus Hodarchaeota archaeon]
MKTDQDTDPNVQKRRKMKIIGIFSLIIGISLIITGIFFSIASFNSMGDPDGNFMLFGGASAGCFFGGGVGIIIALALFSMAYQRAITKYAYEETGMALGTASERAVEGYGRIIGKGSEAMTRGIRNAGGIKHDVDIKEREIIKIKCQACGALNDEDANFCDNCGQAI